MRLNILVLLLTLRKIIQRKDTDLRYCIFEKIFWFFKKKLFFRLLNHGANIKDNLILETEKCSTFLTICICRVSTRQICTLPHIVLSMIWSKSCLRIRIHKAEMEVFQQQEKNMTNSMRHQNREDSVPVKLRQLAVLKEKFILIEPQRCRNFQTHSRP